MKKAVVFGVNFYIGLGVARCLAKEDISIVATMMDGVKVKYGNYSRYIDERIHISNVIEKPSEVLEQLIDYGKKQREKPVIIPTLDSYVEFIDMHLEELKEYYLIPPIPKGLYTKLLDKDSLAELAFEHGVLIPKVINVKDDHGFYSEVEEKIGYPCLIKPVSSHKFVPIFREKMFIIKSRNDLEKGLEKVKKHNVEVFVQQLIKGFDDHMYTFDCYINKEGELTHWSTFQKQRQFPINFGASTYIKQKYVPELYEIGSNFLLKCGYRGFAEIEFKKDQLTGRFYLIEVNVRITNFNILLKSLGINIPLILFKDLNEQKIEKKSISQDTNLHFWYSFEDFMAIKEYLKSNQLTFWQVLRSLLNKKVNAIWSIHDPLPFFYYVYEKLVKKYKN